MSDTEEKVTALLRACAAAGVSLAGIEVAPDGSVSLSLAEPAVDEPTAARLLGISERKLRGHRLAGETPYLDIGGSPRYEMHILRAWYRRSVDQPARVAACIKSKKSGASAQSRFTSTSQTEASISSDTQKMESKKHDHLRLGIMKRLSA